MTASPLRFMQMQRMLQGIRRRWLLLHMLVGVLLILGWSALVLAAMAWVEMALRPPVWLRYAMIRGVCLPGVACLCLWGAWRVRRQSGLAQVARRFQDAHGGLGSRIEGALQLWRQGGDAPLALAALEQVAGEVSACSPPPFRITAFGRRSMHVAFGGGVLLALFCLLRPYQMENALRRLFFPSATVEKIGRIRIASVVPGDVEVVEGADLSVTVKADSGNSDIGAVLAMRTEEPGGEADIAQRRLTKTDEFGWTYLLRAVRKSFRYQVRLGSTESRWYAVKVIPRPAVRSISGRVMPPSYTGVSPFVLAGESGAIRAPAGSRVSLDIQVNHPVREALLQVSSGMTFPLANSGSTVLSGALDISASGTYVVSLLDSKGNTNDNPLSRPIECIPDALPVLRIRQPRGTQKVGLGESIPLVMEAADDYGMRTATLYFRRNQHGEPQSVKRWTFPGHGAGMKQPLTLGCEFFVTAPAFDVGDSILLYAEGTDHAPVRAGEGEGRSGRVGRSMPVTVLVINREMAARKERATLEKVYRRLEKILAAQVEIRQATAALAGGLHGADELLRRQTRLRTDVLDAAGLLTENGSAVAQRIRTVLRGLAANELADASAALLRAVREEIPEQRIAGITAALPAQSEVVRRLRQILGILPALQAGTEQPEDVPAEADLPPEARQQGEALKAALDKFRQEQKKVLDALQLLEKKQVDDFTEADNAEIEDLRVAEENLRNFLKDIHSDLSKVPKQDFSNPSLLGDTLSILEEVEMAEGALAQKETEIATTAATTGMELAESLTTHLEKWLSDKPDRTAWKMEEPLGDYETPMAELPDKIEDIVGELLEQEEDLMQEAEDASSSWADSLDKGAGWDAMDGPISNYSAQGVTGNALPNESEIGGRSGEGRQGRSHGEMVSDTTVGKGGRKTPSRLTPDAFEQGQINDQSTDASGGATGGGKAGAAGAEGLEGPAPPPDTGPMPRLAGRQAELRDKTERIALNLKLQGYNTAILENTLAEMRGIEHEMKSGRYASAARRRRVLLDSLRSAQDELASQAQIRADRAAALPRDVQRELLDAVESGMPEAYEDLVKSYYERLAEE